MPAYNFKKQFADAVEQRIKRQTIRRRRKRPTQKGDQLFLYTGMRTKQCRRLRVETCREVVPILIMGLFNIMIYPENNSLQRALSGPEIEILAKADGFASVSAFQEFFDSTYGLPFKGELIRW